MSLVFNMAGGGSSVEPFAAISVTYPAGSACTCTDGTTTYTAPNTNGATLFIIPYAATWTVTATDGTETTSQTVEITTEGQSVSVELSYVLWLYKPGDQCVDVTGGWEQYQQSGLDRGTVRFEDDGIYTATTTGQTADIATKNPIDLTGISTLKITLDAFEHNSSSLADGYIGVVASKPPTMTGNSYTKFRGTTAELDVSALNGEYYVYYSTGYIVTSTVKNINLE